MSHARSEQTLDLSSLQTYANSRGGSCLSPSFKGARAPHLWKCGLGHEFEARPQVLIEGGYWCERCQPSLDTPGAWDWGRVAQTDPAVARFHRAEDAPSSKNQETD